MLVPIDDPEVTEMGQLIDLSRVAEVDHKNVFFEFARHLDMVVEVPASGSMASSARRGPTLWLGAIDCSVTPTIQLS